jgi:hypothetical protein
MKKIALQALQNSGFIRIKPKASLAGLNILFPEGIPVYRVPLSISLQAQEENGEAELIDCFEIDRSRVPEAVRAYLAQVYVRSAEQCLLEAIARNKGSIFPIPVEMADTVSTKELQLQKLVQSAIAHLRFKKRIECQGLAWAIGLNKNSAELKAVIQRLEEMGVGKFKRDYGYSARYIDWIVWTGEESNGGRVA